MAADAVIRQDMELASLSPETVEKLNSILSRRWSHGNPIDMGGDRFNYRCLWPLIEDENIDASLVLGSPAATRRFLEWYSRNAPWMTNVDEMKKLAEDDELKELERMKEMRARFSKPVVFCAMGIDIVKQGEVYSWLEQNYLVPYPTPERGTKALSRLMEYSEYLGILR